MSVPQKTDLLLNVFKLPKAGGMANVKRLELMPKGKVSSEFTRSPVPFFHSIMPTSSLYFPKTIKGSTLSRHFPSQLFFLLSYFPFSLLCYFSNSIFHSKMFFHCVHLLFLLPVEQIFSEQDETTRS